MRHHKQSITPTAGLGLGIIFIGLVAKASAVSLRTDGDESPCIKWTVMPVSCPYRINDDRSFFIRLEMTVVMKPCCCHNDKDRFISTFVIHTTVVDPGIVDVPWFLFIYYIYKQSS